MVTTFAGAASAVREAILKKYPQVDKAFIFGSFSDDKQVEGSDLDVIVELNSGMGLQFIALIEDIEKASGITVDVITVNQARMLEKKFGYDILNRAVPVYEKTKN